MVNKLGLGLGVGFGVFNPLMYAGGSHWKFYDPNSLLLNGVVTQTNKTTDVILDKGLSPTNHGTVSGGVTIEDGAMVFDGTVNGVIISSNTNQFINLNNPFSISVFANRSSLSEFNYLVSLGYSRDIAGGVALQTNRFLIGNTNGDIQNVPFTAPTNNEFHHFVMTVGTNVKIYIDNQLILDTPLLISGVINNTAPSIINSRHRNSGTFQYPFIGSITGVSIFENKTLTPTEITEIYNAGKDSPSPIRDGLVAEYSGRHFLGTELEPTHILDTVNSSTPFKQPTTALQPIVRETNRDNGVVSGGVIIESKKHTNVGVVSGGVTIEDGAMVFDGVNGRVTSQNSMGIIAGGGNTISILLRVKIENVTTTMTLLDTGGDSVLIRTRVQLIDTNKIRLSVRPTGLGTTNIDTPVLSDGIYDIFVYDVGDRIFLQYQKLGGSLVSVGNYAPGGERNTIANRKWDFGSNYDATNYFNNYLYYIRIWSDVLSPIELQAEMNSDYAVKRDGLVAEYSGREFEGTTQRPTLIYNTRYGEGAMVFDGVDGRVIIDNNYLKQNVSISGWVIPKSDGQTFFATTLNNQNYISFRIQSDRLDIRARENNIDFGVRTNQIIEEKLTYFVYNKIGTTSELYINGDLVTIFSNSVGAQFGNDDKTYLGGVGIHNSQTKIYSLKISNPLSQSEITEIYNAGKDSPSPIRDGLVAEYSGRDFTGTALEPELIIDTSKPSITKVEFDNIDDKVTAFVVTPHDNGTLVVATDKGVYSVGVNIPIGNYDFGRYQRFAIFGAFLVDRPITANELVKIKSQYSLRGVTDIWNTVTTFENYWRDMSINTFPAGFLDTVTTGVFNNAFVGNKLNAESVDNILVSLDNSTISNGRVDITGGTNSPPTATGLTAKSNLEGKGWTVNVES